MAKYKAIIFDLDGVICHTDVYHYQAWKMIADRINAPFNTTVNNRLRGVSRMASLDIILEKYDGTFSDSEKLTLANEKNDCYGVLLQQMTPSDLPLEVKSTLDTLRNNCVPIAIGSSSKNAVKILEKIGLERFFDAISDGNNISRSKPDPQVFVMAAQMLDIAPCDCLVVEDAVSGLQAAKAAGMGAAGIGSAANSEIADYSLGSFSDLLSIMAIN